MHRKGMELLSRRERASEVWRASDGRVYKMAPKFLIDNEWYFLDALKDSGYVLTGILRVGLEVISMPYIDNMAVTDAELFMSHLNLVLAALRFTECRHGDLTKYSVLVQDNKPVIIDFGESRHMCSPLPDKRKEGDRYWLTKTMKELAYEI